MPFALLCWYKRIRRKAFLDLTEGSRSLFFFTRISIKAFAFLLKIQAFRLRWSLIGWWVCRSRRLINCWLYFDRVLPTWIDYYTAHSWNPLWFLSFRYFPTYEAISDHGLLAVDSCLLCLHFWDLWLRDYDGTLLAFRDRRRGRCNFGQVPMWDHDRAWRLLLRNTFLREVITLLFADLRDLSPIESLRSGPATIL